MTTFGPGSAALAMAISKAMAFAIAAKIRVESIGIICLS